MSLFMLGIYNKELKLEVTKIEKDFMYPLKEKKAKKKKKKGLMGKIKDFFGAEKKGGEEPAEEQTGTVEALQIKKEQELEGKALLMYRLSTGIDATVMT